ncbi:MAG: ribbon-helix-helix protein, CopG family [Propionibacteriaceae bacterium]|jgi:RHH-type rel operon transcriptional repressor/antitoxin RelB|nr:ribbon-helix-helix protein, CopG family [Propionibacteriaceae bacterium]
MSQMIAVRLPDELSDRLTALATQTRRSKATYVREALEAELDRIEYEEGILRAASDYRAGRAETISENEVIKRLGLED